MEVHIHIHHHDKLDSINLKLDKIMGALDDVKAKLVTSNEKIDILTTASEGVAKDIAAIKLKLEQNQGGIDAAGVAELSSIIDATNEKLTVQAQKLADLDASTDDTNV